VTDANLLLGRLITDYFPKIFGKSEKEPLDIAETTTAFEKLASEINHSHDGENFSLDEVAYGSARPAQISFVAAR
jgi:5-oxoprolinase (ATP-hydrolysing)